MAAEEFVLCVFISSEGYCRLRGAAGLLFGIVHLDAVRIEDIIWGGTFQPFVQAGWLTKKLGLVKTHTVLGRQGECIQHTHTILPPKVAF